MADYLREIYSDLMKGMCEANCSGHGDCLNGTCICEVKFAGSECGGVNMSYYTTWACIYLFVALITFGQLLMSLAMSCRSGRRNDKGNRLREVLSPTTPKTIYAVVFVAASLRAAYFASAAVWANDSLLSLLSAYYPLLLTGSSLIVCFWAEIFHLRNVCFESHRFLSKSFLGFVTFNVITYSVLVAQMLLVLANNNQEEKNYYLNVFNGCYAFLLFVVVVFFLIYGVEVYFKIKPEDHPVNTSQLNQSRLGLVSQALMLLITIVFILSDVMGQFWKDKVPVESRNYHDIIFRMVEVGVALWFPCVLWNVHSPETLWILNPKKILRLNHKTTVSSINEEERYSHEGSTESIGCYFCYDPEATHSGPLIQPCECRGDVSTVHHECLRRWLLTKASSGVASCSVCKTPYKLEREKYLSWSACSDVSAAHWLRFSLMIAAISGIIMSTWALCHILPTPPWKILVIGVAVVITYVILKFLGQSTYSAYQQAKVSSVRILSRAEEQIPASETKI